jgi:excisionase family DNA binding protein
MDVSECMTVAEAAKELRLSKSRVEQFIADGRLKVAGVLGNVRLVLKSDVTELKKVARPEGRPPKRREKRRGKNQA